LGIHLSNVNEKEENTMSEIILNPDQVKEILKSAIIELLRDNREEVSEFLADLIEDVAMERAIAEGETTELTSRDSIFQLLEPKA
jgi:hypothetical protein